ncbi:MAG: RNA-protein complex protein Nop10 [Thermoprotei archaeon]|nr:MAG: RNA-protein complex protein Nop10 [Thermoprotei archaeon]
MGKRGYLRKCEKCNRYTLRNICPICEGRVKSPHPARFSLEDRFGKYRRRLLIEKDP